MIERTAATVHPIGHANQIPTVPKAVSESTMASPTLKIKSVNVVIINLFIIFEPRKIPSATNFAEITK